MTGFERFRLSDAALRGLAERGYETPTPVQAAAIAPAVAGRDLVAEAPTGTGKTAVYALALIERTPANEPHVALVLVPTRELAEQVATEVNALGAPKGYRAFAVTGGIREGLLLDRMTRASCIVATPGRLLDLVEKDEMTLSGVATVVLDEADRMLDEGFLPDMEEVLELTSRRRQTIITSATLAPEVLDLASRFQHEPEVVRAGGVASGVVHHRLNVRDGEKTDALEALLRSAAYDRALVFMRTRANVDATARELRARGLMVDLLHGERDAFQRRHVMDLFRKGVSRIVLATDVASRGLDVPEIELVVNFDLPLDADSYTHRAGRAGRMGREGRVVTFVTPREKEARLALERAIGLDLVPYRLEVEAKPTAAPPAMKARRRKPKASDAHVPPKSRPPPSRESRARRAERLGRDPSEDRRRGRRQP